MICYDCKKMLDCWIWKEAIIDGEDGVYDCEEFNPKNNFCRIKNMNIEEMAEMLFEEMENTISYCDYCEHYKYPAPHCSAPDTKQGCINAIKKYLESEVQGE